MIACTKRALPGITLSLFMSVSMAVPALAASHEALAPRKTQSHAPAHRVLAAGRSKTVGNPAVKSGRTASRSHSAARPRVGGITAPPSHGNVIAIRKTSFTGHVDHTLIDDGTLWREHGSVATWQQTGVASWYGGKRWQGHRTSSGATYDENALTAAHATLPLGTRVRVSSHNGARSVIVTINDRPGTRSRIIDLSREAAKELGILDTGVAMVTLQPM